MSLSYAARLTQGVDYGECGLPEKEDTRRVRAMEMGKLVKLVSQAQHLVIHTGAGISTACGIRDFRGPNGVWTRERKGLGLQLLPGDVPFDEASPSLTHMAILALVNAGKCKWVVSQNVDGLHKRSGMPSDRLSELHGNIFEETCHRCHKVYFRNFDVGGVGFKKTPRTCDDCGGELFDQVLDWEDALPDRDFTLARVHSLMADVSLALGTSMRVHPAATIPLLTVDKTGQKHATLSDIELPLDEMDHLDEHLLALQQTDRGKKLRNANGRLALINLQTTPHEDQAFVKLHVKCDEVMAELMKLLKIPIPPFVRNETYTVATEADGTLVVSTDEYVRNCLFAQRVDVWMVKNAPAVKNEHEAPTKQEDLEHILTFEGPPFSRVGALAHITEPNTRLRVVVTLNANATIPNVELFHNYVPGVACKSQMTVEVVRKVYDDGETGRAHVDGGEAEIKRAKYE